MSVVPFPQPKAEAVDVEHVTTLVRRILVDVLGIDESATTREADIIDDLGADEDDLTEIDEQVGDTFHIEQFNCAWDAWFDDKPFRVADLVDAVVDVRLHVPAEKADR